MAKNKGQDNKSDDKKPDDKKPEQKKSPEQINQDEMKNRSSAWMKEGRENGTNGYKEFYPRNRRGGFYILHVIFALWIVYVVIHTAREEKSKPKLKPQERSVPKWTVNTAGSPSLSA
ncbi:MAG: hypothetical protein V4519_04120 [Patescibacteria group bacterium]